MAQPYVGEIRMFGGNFAPAGWKFCNGAVVLISEFTTLFNIIGTTYGGDGVNTFALPNLCGRAPIHQGNSLGATYVIGEASGSESVTLQLNQLPIHTHALQATNSGSASASPAGALPAQTSSSQQNAFLYAAAAPSTNLNPASIRPTGSSLPHNNLQPFQCVSFIISMFGIFPSQS